MNVFFCDIRGTLTGENEEEELKIFFDNLRKLKESYKMDSLEFSLITTDEVSYLKMELDKIAKCNLDKIDLKTQFCRNAIIEGNEIKETDYFSKSEAIIKYIKDKDVQNIFFVDDSPTNIFITSRILKKLFPNVNIEMLNPHGIHELNEILQNEYCQSKHL